MILGVFNQTFLQTQADEEEHPFKNKKKMTKRIVSLFDVGLNVVEAMVRCSVEVTALLVQTPIEPLPSTQVLAAQAGRR